MLLFLFGTETAVKKVMVMKNLLTIPFVFCAFFAFGQQTKHFNLYDLKGANKLQVVQRQIEPLLDGAYKGVRLSQDTGEGLAWIRAESFSLGTIEFDVRGKDEMQRSFVGIAFHGQDDQTFEAVYFRPFNFLAKDSVRRIHAVQYISHPVHTWKNLRENPVTNSKFEKEVSNPPDPMDGSM